MNARARERERASFFMKQKKDGDIVVFEDECW